MSGPKYTHGPWKPAGRSGGWDGVDAADGTPICALEFNEPANARLIAAAPELVDALRLALEVIERLGNYLNDTDDVDEELEADVNPKIAVMRAALRTSGAQDA